MKKIKIVDYVPPDRSADYTDQHQYTTYINQEYYTFSNERKLKTFMQRVSDKLTEIGHSLNSHYVQLFGHYRHIWIDASDRQGIADKHELVSSIKHGLTPVDELLNTAFTKSRTGGLYAGSNQYGVEFLKKTIRSLKYATEKEIEYYDFRRSYTSKLLVQSIFNQLCFLEYELDTCAKKYFGQEIEEFETISNEEAFGGGY